MQESFLTTCTRSTAGNAMVWTVLLFVVVCIRPVVALLALSENDVENDDLRCAEIWDLFPNSTEDSVPNREGYFVAVTHPHLDAVKGYVPNEKYNIKITSHDLRGFYEYTVVVFSAKFQGQFLGTLLDHSTGGREVTCGNETSKPSLVISQTRAPEDVKYAIDLEWISPSSPESGCAIFVAQLTRHHSTLVYTETSFCANHGCYKHFKGAYGEIEVTENGPSVCWILVEVPISHQISLQVKRLSVEGDLQCSHSNLALSNNETEERFSAGVTLCVSDAADLVGKIFRSRNEFMFVRVLVGQLSEINIKMRYYGLSKERGCNVSVSNEESGVITSPNYPDDYFPGLDCFYGVMGTDDQRLEFQFLHLDIDDRSQMEADDAYTSQFCPYDFLKIVDGVEPSERQQWCGTLSNDTLARIGPRQTVSNFLALNFHTDDQAERSGFLIYWKAIGSCRDSLYLGTEGVITSVNYPRNYLNDQHCMYTIRVPEGYIVELQFTVFHLEPLNHFAKECKTDYVAVERRKRCGSWIGKENLLKFYSDDNELNITFHSNSLVTGPGFKAEYKAVLPNSSHECPPHLFQFENLCYQIIHEPTWWFGALDDCKMRGAVLAMIPTPEVEDFLDSVLKKESEDVDAYWVGATDIQYEADFTWVDGSRINHSNWFPGWPEFGNYNHQPNDDGLSNQNCLELRRKFVYPSKGVGTSDRFYWNDRDCRAADNGYICQFVRPGGTASRGRSDVLCNGSIALTTTAWHATVYSPYHPSKYPDFLECFISIELPEKAVAVLEFTKFILESNSKDESCGFDYLEIWEEGVDNGTWTVLSPAKHYCGDWSHKLKLLRRIVRSGLLVLHLHTDHSRGYPGFMANIFLEEETRRSNPCNNKKFISFQKNCYLFVSYPEVTWNTAKEICRSSGASLASISSVEEEAFVVYQILRSQGYNSGDRFWIGGTKETDVQTEEARWVWVDESDFNFTEWFQGSVASGVPKEPNNFGGNENCLVLQQQFRKSEQQAHSYWTADKPYWNDHNCDLTGGYVCKMPRPAVSEGQKFNLTFDSLTGNISLPNYPGNYPNNFNYQVTVRSPPSTRILVSFHMIDTEYQDDCLYDYVHLKTFPQDQPEAFCGNSIPENQGEFASSSNQVIILFHSDYSVTATGFVASWQVVNISDCKVDRRMAVGEQGYLRSVNYPFQYLNALECHAKLQGPVGSRVGLDFFYFDVGEERDLSCAKTDYVTVYLDGDYGRRNLRICGAKHLTGESRGWLFLSYESVLSVAFHSDANRRGAGFLARYLTVERGNISQEITFHPNDSCRIQSPNFPFPIPPGMCLEQMYRVPYGYQIHLDFNELYFDPVQNGADVSLMEARSNITGEIRNFTYTSPWNRVLIRVCTLTTQKNVPWRRYQAQLNILADEHFWTNKSLENISGIIESCSESPCKNGGTCVETGQGPVCQCPYSHLGVFCHFSQCDFTPCVHGKCVLVNSEARFYCNCFHGFTGVHCEYQIHPCNSNPCQHGECVESVGLYVCNCVEGYKGTHCEKLVLFDARTLRESFLRDPFWLGLFMVLGVMAFVGIVHWWRKRASQFRGSGFFCEGDAPESGSEDDEKELVQSAPPMILSEDVESGEIFINLAELGIDSAQYSSLNLGNDVAFKMKLSDLSEEQLEALERYLEQILEIYEEEAAAKNEERETEERDLLIDIGSPDSEKTQISSPTRSIQSPRRESGQGKGCCLDEALDGITELVLKSAVVISPLERMVSASEMLTSDGDLSGNLVSQRSLNQGAENKQVKQRFDESNSSGTKTKLRDAAKTAMRLVRRPQSGGESPKLPTAARRKMISSVSLDVSSSNLEDMSTYV